MCYVQGFTDEAVAGFSVRRDGRLPGWVVVPQVGLEPTTHERDLDVGLPSSRRAQRVTILVTDSRCRHHARQAGQPHPTHIAPGP